MNALSLDFSPRSGSAAEWSAARGRLGDYFRAHRVESRGQRAGLMAEVLRRAARRHEEQPEQSPTAVAIQEARRMQGDWLRGGGGDGEIAEGRREVQGRLAYLLGEGNREQAGFLGGSGEVSAEWVAAVRVALGPSGPELAVSRMVAQPIDWGVLPRLVEGTGGFWGRHPWVRGAALGALAGGLWWAIW